MAFPDFIGVAGTVSTAKVTSLDVSIPGGGANDGNLLILVMCAEGPTGAVNTPTGWFDAGSSGGNGPLRWATYARKSNGTDGSTVAVTWSTSAYVAAQCFQWYNWGGTLSTDVDIADATGNSTTPDAPSVTAGWGSADNWWGYVSCSANDGATMSTWASNYILNQTSTVNTNGGSNDQCAVHSQHQKLASGSHDPGTQTLSQSQNWAALHFVIEPGSSGSALITDSNLPAGALTLTGQTPTALRSLLSNLPTVRRRMPPVWGIRPRAATGRRAA